MGRYTPNTKFIVSSKRTGIDSSAHGSQVPLVTKQANYLKEPVVKKATKRTNELANDDLKDTGTVEKKKTSEVQNRACNEVENIIPRFKKSGCSKVLARKTVARSKVHIEDW